MLTLSYEHGGRRRSVTLGAAAVTVGSARHSDLVIRSRRVSPDHVVLKRTAGGVDVRDLGSVHGTWLEGGLVRHEVLVPPFRLALGGSVLVDVLGAPEDCEAPAPSSAAVAAGSAPAAAEFPCAVLRALARSASSRAALTGVLFAARDTGLAAAGVVGRSALDGSGVAIHDAFGDRAGWPDLARSLAHLQGEGGDPGPAASAAGRTSPDVAWRALPDGAGSLVFLALSDRPPGFDWRPVLDALQAALGVGTNLPRAITRRSEPPERFDVVAPDRPCAQSSSPIVRSLHAAMAAATTSDLPVLLLGPTGCGKEVYAASIHHQSRRSRGPFLAVNCSAIPEGLLEAALFGAVAGAATGVHAQPGLLREASGGTLLLDEIGEMSPAMQAKLLRVVGGRESRPLGQSRVEALDVRFIAATNRDLEAAVAAGTFRADLYHRLRGHVFVIPALRERSEDVPRMLNAFVSDESAKSGRELAGISPAAMERLARHDWPGNVRELESLARRLVHETPPGRVVQPEDLPLELRSGTRRAEPSTLEEHLDVVRRRQVLAWLARCRGNHAAAARGLGLSRGGLRNLMARLDLRGA